MKKAIFTFVAALIVSSSQLLHAQMAGGNANPMDSALLKLFGNNTNFSATSEVSISGKSPKDSITMTVGMAALDGKMRSEMDMAQMKNAMISPEMVKQMKQMGADRTINIVRPDKKVNYIVYPSLKAYIEQPSSNTGVLKEPKIQTTALGKETIDGHPCVKNKLVITDENGKSEEATVWNATDLKNFPIQMHMKEQGATVSMKFKNVQFSKPDAKLFEPPAGYTKYGSMLELQQVMMQKMMGGAKP